MSKPTGAALQSTALAFDVAMQHVEEKPHFTPKVIFYAPRGEGHAASRAASTFATHRHGLAVDDVGRVLVIPE